MPTETTIHLKAMVRDLPEFVMDLSHQSLILVSRDGFSGGGYDAYMPQDMMLRTNVLYNFVEENYLLFKSEEYISLTMAYKLYTRE